MSLFIGSYEFAGPYRKFDQLKPLPGLYAVLKEIPPDYELLNYGFTQSVKDTFTNIVDTSNPVTVVVLYEQDKEKVERVLREIETEYGTPDRT